MTWTRTPSISSRTTTAPRPSPSVLPSAFPNFLVNGGTGIAVGMATNLASHNLGEVVDGICAQIDNPEITLPELMQHIKGPDFPVPCEIRGIRGIEEYFRTGRGSMRLRGKMEIEENANGRSHDHHPRACPTA